jgi:hypothetical protein
MLKVQIMTTKNLLWTHRPIQEKVTTARSQDSDKREQGEEHLDSNHLWSPIA